MDGLAAPLASDAIRLAAEPGTLATPGGGYGFRFLDPDGRLVEVSADVAAKPYRASPEYADRWGTAGPGEDLFALWHRTPPETGLWVPAPV